MPRPRAVLVVASVRPEVVDGPCVDVAPGRLATFDGDRLSAPVHVACGDDRRTFERTDHAGVTAAVSESVRTKRARTVRFGNRAVFHRFGPTSSLRSLERRLAEVADREGATLLAWTDAGVPDAHGGVYDVVVE